jgi:hypothetical protein
MHYVHTTTKSERNENKTERIFTHLICSRVNVMWISINYDPLSNAFKRVSKRVLNVSFYKKCLKDLIANKRDNFQRKKFPRVYTYTQSRILGCTLWGWKKLADFLSLNLNFVSYHFSFSFSRTMRRISLYSLFVHFHNFFHFLSYSQDYNSSNSSNFISLAYSVEKSSLKLQ